MTTESGKNWNRAWSSEEILDNADNWSLAGDAALLNTLKLFADNLITKTGVISEKIDTLLNNLNEASLKLDLAQNEFQGLKHTQFIESRVYEDDEALDSVMDPKSEEKAVSEEDQEHHIIEAIKSGMVILNDYYDKIEISVSDSEEETERSYTLKPKDKYAYRPLPPIIGTVDWHKKWNLEDVTSESESDKLSEIYSETDSEDNLPKDLMKGSETSSELDFSSHVSENKPIANSSFNDSVQKSDFVSSGEESDDQESIPVKTPLSNKSFAEQLAAKLGNVISQQEEISPEFNKKQIQPIKTNTFTGGLFSDEPPPLDNSEDSSLEKGNNSGLFSGGKGLFNDNEDESFWGQPKVPEPQKKPHLFVDEDKPVDFPSLLQTGQKATNLPKSSKVSKGLFDSDESSDDDIFSASIKHVSKPPYLQPNKPTLPLFDEEPPKLEETKPVSEEPTIKKPVGAVKIFGSSDLFGDQNITDILKKAKKSIPQTESKKSEIKSAGETSKIIKNISQRKNLFDDDDEDSETVQKPKNESSFKTKKNINLFDDSEDSLPEINKTVMEPKQTQDLRENKEKTLSDDTDSASKILGGSDISKPKKISLFDDEDNVSEKVNKPKKISLFDDDDDLFKDDIFSDITSKPGLKLFSDLEDSLDLFGNKSTNNTKVAESPKPEISVTNKEEIVVEKNNNVKLNFNSSLESDISGGKKLNEKKVSRLFSDSEEEVGNKNKNKNNSFHASNKNDRNIKEDKENSFSVSDENISKNKDKEDMFNISKKSNEKEDKDIFDVSYEKVSRIVRQNSKESPKKSKDQTVEVEEKKTVLTENEENQPPLLEKKKLVGLFSDSEDYDDILKIESKEKSVSVIDQKDEPDKGDMFLEKESEKVVNVTQQIIETDKPESVLVSEIEDSVSKIRESYVGENLFESTGSSEKAPENDSKLANYPNKPDINIFESSPPPDDEDDWDTKSDSLSDDDFLSYRAENTSERSNVFDNEPPSLEPNDSSGIVKDATRIDTDYFYFYPDASSSRRLSSDIFSDQQSQDSFFITKTKSESTKISSNLDIIPETSKSSVIEITPSGNIKDFESTVASSQDPLLSTEQIENVSSEFSNDLSKKPIPDKKTDDVENKAKPELPTSAEKSMKNKISLISDLLKNKPIRTPQNYAKEVKDNAQKSNEESPDNVDVLHCVTKTRAKIPIKRRPSSRRARQEAIRKSAVDLMDANNISDSEVNQEPEKSINKINTSDQQSKYTDTDTKSEKIVTNEQDLFKAASIENELFIDNIEPLPNKQKHSTDLFLSKTEELPNKNLEKKEILFNSSLSDDDDDELFATASKKPNLAKPKDSLFDSDGDSDNDLFSTAKPFSTAKTKQVETENTVAAVTKKSLFEDSSSDDDLFPGLKKQTKFEPVKAITTKSSKIATTQKLENIQSDDDPLSKLLK